MCGGHPRLWRKVTPYEFLSADLTPHRGPPGWVDEQRTEYINLKKKVFNTLLVIMKTLLFRITKYSLFATYLLFASTFLLFSLLEFVPALTEYINLQPVRYYAQRHEYHPDPTLVFIPNRAGQENGTTLQTDFIGDMYSPAYGVAPTTIKYHATYSPDGFRSNSSTSNFQVLVLGDSYVEIGEEDSLTLSEQLKLVSGFTTFNLGRAWYGPFQYLELFKQYGPRVKPQYAVLCFFDGNDVEDTKQYLRWLKGKSYYTFVLSTKSYLGRYFTAFRDSYKYLFKKMETWKDNIILPNTPSSITVIKNQETHRIEDALPSKIHPDLGLIDLNGQLVPMRFNYWNRLTPTEELLRTDEWKAVGQLLKDYQRIATQHAIVPIVVFIPNKVEVYGVQYSEHSGANFLRQIQMQLQFENNSHDAFVALIDEIKLPFVDLLPAFRSLAKEGEVLYYPFDTHWNLEGRRVAAKLIAASLVKHQIPTNQANSGDR